MKRRHLCDVPGCGNERKRHLRLCAACFAALPRNLSRAINDAWRYGERARHREACKRAGELRSAASPAAQPRPAITPQQSYALSQRLLGESDV